MRKCIFRFYPRKKIGFFVALVSTLLLIFSPVDSFASSSDLDEWQSEAEEKSENAVQITSGDFYDAVLSVWPNITITDYQDRTCTIDVTGISDSSKIAVTYLRICARIIGVVDFSADYDRVSVSYLDENIMALFSFYDYAGINDFTTYLFDFSTSDDTSVKDSLDNMYKYVFYNFDSEVKSNVEFNEKTGTDFYDILDMYNDYFWVYASYPVTVNYKIDDGKAVINYKNGGYTDSYDSGYYVFSEMNNSTANYNMLSHVGAGLSFDTIDLLCFSDDDERLFGINITKQSSGGWEKNFLSYYGNDEFKEGAAASVNN